MLIYHTRRFFREGNEDSRNHSILEHYFSCIYKSNKLQTITMKFVTQKILYLVHHLSKARPWTITYYVIDCPKLSDTGTVLQQLIDTYRYWT